MTNPTPSPILTASGRKAGIWPVLFILLSVYLLTVAIRGHAFFALKAPENGIYVPFYNTESASYFRYARMISEGKTVPAIDIPAMFPEGFDVRNTPFAMEAVAGWLHRLPGLRGVPFRLFVEYFDWAFSSLAVFGVFWFGRIVLGGTVPAAAAALLYAVSVATISRTVNGFFEREIFTIPFLALHLALFVRSLRTGTWRSALWPALLMGVVISTWEISKFYLLMIMAYPVLKLVFRFGERDTRDTEQALIRTVLVQTAVLLPLSFLVPYLRLRLFAFSMTMIVQYALIAAVFAGRMIPPAVRDRALAGSAIRAGLFGVFAVGLMLFVPRSEDYSHVYAIFWQKIIRFFHKPADPSELSFAARALWESSFRSPNPHRIAYLFTAFLLIEPVAICLLAKDFFRRKAAIGQEVLLFFSVEFIAAFLLFERLQVFAVITCALGAGYVLGAVLKASAPRWRWVPFVVLAGIVLFEGGKSWTMLAPRPFFYDALRSVLPESEEFGPALPSAVQLIEWIKSRTGERDVVCSDYALCPPILVYTGRPVTLSPYFEPVSRREKIRVVYTSLYGTEDEFCSVLDRYGIDWFVYSIGMDLNTSVYSIRYLVDRMERSTNQAAWLMQFRPERLRRLRLVYQNEFFRVYGVRPGPAPDAGPMGYQACYDEDFFRRNGSGPFEFLMAWRDSYYALFSAATALREKDLVSAERDYQAALGTVPRHPAALVGLARVSLARRRLPEAEVFLARAQEVHPTLESEYGLAVTAAMRGESRTAVERLRNVLRIDPGYPPAVYDYIRILGEQGKTAEAERVLKSAIRGNPGEAGFVRILARLYSATGRKDLADRLMKTITDGGTGPVF
jgi:hypothetical protein